MRESNRPPGKEESWLLSKNNIFSCGKLSKTPLIKEENWLWLRYSVSKRESQENVVGDNDEIWLSDRLINFNPG